MKIIQIALMAMICINGSILSQGTIQLSNIGNVGGQIFNGFAPAGSDVCVSLALPNGTLVGKTANILGGGFFSAGLVTLDGITGEVELKLAAWWKPNPALKHYSDVFSVVLGGGNPPLPAATIPPSFSGIQIQPLTPPTIITKTITIRKDLQHQFFKAPGMKIVGIDGNKLILEYQDVGDGFRSSRDLHSLLNN